MGFYTSRDDAASQSYLSVFTVAAEYSKSITKAIHDEKISTVDYWARQ